MVFITPEELEEVNNFYLRRRRINNYCICDVFPKEINLRDNPLVSHFSKYFFLKKKNLLEQLELILAVKLDKYMMIKVVIVGGSFLMV